jgi:hypothetical protein
MIAHNKSEITRRFNDNAGMQRALDAALDDARKLHAAHGVPMVTMRDGKIVEVDPVTLEVIRVVDEQPDEPADKPAADDTAAD